MNEVRRILRSPQLRSRLPAVARAHVGWWLYQLGHTALDTAVFNSVVIDWLDRSDIDQGTYS